MVQPIRQLYLHEPGGDPTFLSAVDNVQGADRSENHTGRIVIFKGIAYKVTRETRITTNCRTLRALILARCKDQSISRGYTFPSGTLLILPNTEYA